MMDEALAGAVLGFHPFSTTQAVGSSAYTT